MAALEGRAELQPLKPHTPIEAEAVADGGPHGLRRSLEGKDRRLDGRFRLSTLAECHAALAAAGCR